MLAMRQINYITESINVVGKSISEVARESGYSRNTIRKYLDKSDYNLVIRKKRNSILDPFKKKIDEWLEQDLNVHYKQRHTARRVFDRLVKECGYPGRIRTVEMYVKEKKRSLRQRIQDTALHIKRPIEEAQVDFGQFHYFDEFGKDLVGNALVMSFPSSNACYWQATPSQNQECLLESLIAIFEHLGGVPKRMVFDNMSSAVAHIEKDGTRRLVDQFARFLRHYGIEAVFCNPARGQEKGNVEANVGYLRRNMLVPVPMIRDFTSFNLELFKKCEEEMMRNHHIRDEPIIGLLAENKQVLMPLPTNRFIVGRTIKVKTDKHSYFQFEKNKYSTKPGLNNQEILIQITAGFIRVLDQDQTEVDIHQRYYQEMSDPIVNWKHYLNLIARKPRAIKYTGFYRSLSTPWKLIFETLTDQDCAAVLKKFGDKILTDAPEDMARVLQKVMKNSRLTSDALAIALRRQHDGELVKDIVFTNENIPNLTPYKIDLSKYDTMIKRGVEV